jgi:hypothetical protein
VKRREFIAGLGATAWPLAARAQERSQIKRIAFIVSAGAGQIEVVFRQELAKLGWVEGHNVRIEALIETDNRIVRAAAPFVVSTAPDLIVVISTEFAEIFKELTDTIPIVFAFVADPIARNANSLRGSAARWLGRWWRGGSSRRAFAASAFSWVALLPRLSSSRILWPSSRNCANSDGPKAKISEWTFAGRPPMQGWHGPMRSS